MVIIKLKFYKIIMLSLIFVAGQLWLKPVLADSSDNIRSQQASRVIIDETVTSQQQDGSTNIATLIFSVIGSLGLFGIAFLAIRSFYNNSKQNKKPNDN